MAVMDKDDGIVVFEDWYNSYNVDPRDGCLDVRGLSVAASELTRKYEDYKREMDGRCANFHNLELLADGEVISKKPDLPNVSSGETAGIVRRIARNLVQNTPNVEVISKFDDDSTNGIFVSHVLKSKIIGTNLYSNDMQQHLFAATKTGLTIGFSCAIPCLTQDAAGGWSIEFDSIHYRDVFPEPGAKDVRQATEVFVRRYLTKGEIKSLIRNNVAGWDIAALKQLVKQYPSAPPKHQESNALQDTKRKTLTEGYEVITWYTSSGMPFLTFSANTKNLLRIEKNLHPLKWHPVFFLILEKDDQQPLGKSQVELLLGRQEFQDLMHNGAMKLWYRNINPSIIGFGAVNAIPNLSPGKYTQISNPNARIEPFEVNTQTLLQYNTISQSNLGAMVNLVGSSDQQMAMQAGGGMSATPQGVEAQTAMVDITTNNYQKAIEQFFSHYCSYALTIFFRELKHVKAVTLTSEARQSLLNAGLDPNLISEDNQLEIDFSDLSKEEYFVRCIPGSLVEMEDEKQLRILNQLFVPLSQALPALASTGDAESVSNAAAAMQFVVQRVIELSGSNRSKQLSELLVKGESTSHEIIESVDESFESMAATVDNLSAISSMQMTMQEQIKMLVETQGLILQKLGAGTNQSTPNQVDSGEGDIAVSP